MTITQVQKYELALRLLGELNCPQPIMEAIEFWGMFVHEDETKLHNWAALSRGGIVDGEFKEVPRS